MALAKAEVLGFGTLLNLPKPDRGFTIRLFSSINAPSPCG
jgi:hypothetical protein